MSIRFQCECGKKLKATDDKIGKRVLCPDCGEPVTVPKSDRMKVEAIDVAADGGQPLQDSARTARELLKLSSAASREEQEAAKPDATTRKRGEEATVSMGEYVQYNFKRVGLPAIGVVVGCFVLYNLSYWMVGNKPTYPELHPVSGRVTLNGQPLTDAYVTFRLQAAGMSEESASSSTGRTDGNGEYTLEYVDGVPGAVKGVHIVEISHTGANGIETLPAKFHVRSKLQAEVKPDKSEGYDFALQGE